MEFLARLLLSRDLNILSTGSGIKYSDYSLGVGLSELEPTPVDLDLTQVSFLNIRREDSISETKKDEIEAAILEGISLLQGS